MILYRYLGIILIPFIKINLSLRLMKGKEKPKILTQNIENYQGVLDGNPEALKHKKEYDKMLNHYSFIYTDLTFSLAKKFRRKKILFRAHPNEDKNHWIKKFKNFPNITISNNKTAFEDILATAQKFVDQGKIRHLGLSNETPYGLSKLTVEVC